MIGSIRKMMTRDDQVGNRGRRPAPRRAWQAGSVDQLEDRKLMTVVVAPQFGAESVTSNSGSHMSSAPVYLIFQGAQWTTSNTQQYITETKNFLSSSYLSVLKQYGSDGLATYGGSTIDNGAITAVSDSSIEATVLKATSSGALPAPSATSHAPIYAVVTWNVFNSSHVGDAGYNQTYTSNGTNYSTVWDDCLFLGETKPDPDAFSLLLSHETAELMSNGVQVSKGQFWTGGGDSQIGDREGNSYSYRMSNGVLVQPVWSANDRGWAVYDGNPYTITVDAKNKDFQITGDGGGIRNDSVQIDQDASGHVSLMLDGTPFNFSGQNSVFNAAFPYINVNLGGGSNHILIDSLNSSSTVLAVNSNSTGSDAVTVGNGNLSAVQGVVWANDKQANIIVDGSKETTGRSYTVTNTTVTLPGNGFALNYSNGNAAYTASSLSILEGSGSDGTDVVGTNAAITTSVDTGAGSNFVYVQSTSGALNLTTLSGQDLVFVGFGSLANIAAPVSLSNTSGHTSLTLDDSNDSNAESDRLSNSAMTMGGRTIVNYKFNTLNASSLSLVEGAGNTNLFVDSTATMMPVTVSTGDGVDFTALYSTGSAFSIVPGKNNTKLAPDTVVVGSGSLASIGGPVNISNTSAGVNVKVVDIGDTVARKYVVNSGSVTAQGLPTINFSGLITSLSIEDGSAPSTFEIDGLPNYLYTSNPAPMTVFANTADVITGPLASHVTRSHK